MLGMARARRRRRRALGWAGLGWLSRALCLSLSVTLMSPERLLASCRPSLLCACLCSLLLAAFASPLWRARERACKPAASKSRPCLSDLCQSHILFPVCRGVWVHSPGLIDARLSPQTHGPWPIQGVDCLRWEFFLSMHFLALLGSAPLWLVASTRLLARLPHCAPCARTDSRSFEYSMSPVWPVWPVPPSTDGQWPQHRLCNVEGGHDSRIQDKPHSDNVHAPEYQSTRVPEYFTVQQQRQPRLPPTFCTPRPPSLAPPGLLLSCLCLTTESETDEPPTAVAIRHHPPWPRSSSAS